ncbi:MAG: helix-turn-helix transcriptional regulator [Candidatus Limnocylindria bacterium]
MRSARRRAGLTQRALAERAGVPQPTIAAIEAGRQDPRFSTLLRLLRASGAELESVPLTGIGVDRSLIRELLKLTPAQRVRAVPREARFVSELDRVRKR